MRVGLVSVVLWESPKPRMVGVFGEAIVGVGDAGGEDVGFNEVGFLGFAGEFMNVFAEGFVEVDGLFVEDDRDVGLL